MPRVLSFELISAELPFRHAFRHAAASRKSSQSLFLKCVTDSGAVGFGECLPREYVTGETRDAAFTLLQRSILPRLVGMKFASVDDLRKFLYQCDGKAPADWVAAHIPQSAAWCAVDLALLDAFGRAGRQPVRLRASTAQPDGVRYSAVISAASRWRLAMSLLRVRLYGMGQIKLKVGTDVFRCARIARNLMGKDTALRVDANMAWETSEALGKIRALQRLGIRCVEQPLNARNLQGLARLVRETESEIIADESFSDRESLARLVDQHACTGVNVRISKCGGLVASARRCAEAASAGLTVQIGCHVGESSLLSSAQLILIGCVRNPRYLEGCYGRHLLTEDPVRPCLQLRYGGRPPRLPEGAGLGVEVDEARLRRWAHTRVIIARCASTNHGGTYVTGSQTDFLTDRAADSQRV